MDLTLSDLDATVSRDRAAELLRVTPIYIQQLCKQGQIRGELVRGQGPGHKAWSNIVTMDLIVYAAMSSRVARPEEIVAALPARCPRCDILSDGLCDDCKAALAGVPYYARRADVEV